MTTVLLPVVMTPELTAALRRPFEPQHMGKLPKITCGGCRGTRSRPNPQKVCGDHRKARCPECLNWITTEHMHLDYVGHAEVTDRLLAVDPLWTWEPLAFDTDGLPKFDGNGGLWIRLTVAGHSRIGYGDAGAKSGPDAVKEVIGDAIRNAAMRFGVALDLWGATFKAAEDDAEATMRERAPEVPEDEWENATPVHGRGQAPAEQTAAPAGPARPVNKGPDPVAYNPSYYTSGVDAIAAASGLVQLEDLAAHVEKFAAAGMVNAAEAGRLRLKLGARRDALMAARPVTPDASTDQDLIPANVEN